MSREVKSHARGEMGRRVRTILRTLAPECVSGGVGIGGRRRGGGGGESVARPRLDGNKKRYDQRSRLCYLVTPAMRGTFDVAADIDGAPRGYYIPTAAAAAVDEAPPRNLP